MTWVEECDFGARRPAEARRRPCCKACALSLREFPELNARLEGDEIVYLDRYDLGFAVQTDARPRRPGRPRLRHAHRSTSSTPTCAGSPRARAPGRSPPEELRGSTFTVTSAGKLAGLFQTPIVNHPEVAILSVGRIADAAGRPRRRARRRPRREHRAHVRPPRRRRRAGRGVRARRDPPARSRLRRGPVARAPRQEELAWPWPFPAERRADLAAGVLRRVDVRVRGARTDRLRRPRRTRRPRCPVPPGRARWRA